MSKLKRIKNWFRRQYSDPFTVVCDFRPFWRRYNEVQSLFRVNGLDSARSVGRRWVAMHPYGETRILEGHHWWPWEKR